MTHSRIRNFVGYTFGRILSPNGLPIQDEFEIANGTSIIQAPLSTNLSNGHLFIVWPSYNGSLIVGRLVYANGTHFGSAFLVTEHNSLLNFQLIVSEHNILIMWIGSSDNTGPNTYGRLYSSANGTALTDEFLIFSNFSFASSLSAAPTSNGNYLIVWQNISQIYWLPLDTRTASNPHQEFSSSHLHITSTLNRNVSPSIFGLPNGNAMLAWENERIETSSIYGMVLYANGTMATNDFQVNQHTLSTELAVTTRSSPSSTTMANNNAVFLVWQSDQTGDADLYGKVVTFTPLFCARNFVVNQNTTGWIHLIFLICFFSSQYWLLKKQMRNIKCINCRRRSDESVGDQISEW